MKVAQEFKKQLAELGFREEEWKEALFLQTAKDSMFLFKRSDADYRYQYVVVAQNNHQGIPDRLQGMQATLLQNQVVLETRLLQPQELQHQTIRQVQQQLSASAERRQQQLKDLLYGPLPPGVGYRRGLGK